MVGSERAAGVLEDCGRRGIGRIAHLLLRPCPDRSCLGARACTQLAKTRRDVVGDGLLRKMKCRSDLGVSLAGSDEPQHFPFPFC